MKQTFALSNLQQEWDPVVEGGVPGRATATTSATKQEPTPICEGVQTLWILVLSSAEIQKGPQGSYSTWPCLHFGQRERGCWCLAQQTSVLLFCG